MLGEIHRIDTLRREHRIVHPIDRDTSVAIEALRAKLARGYFLSAAEYELIGTRIALGLWRSHPQASSSLLMRMRDRNIKLERDAKKIELVKARMDAEAAKIRERERAKRLAARQKRRAAESWRKGHDQGVILP